jgi:uncharacterized protein
VFLLAAGLIGFYVAWRYVWRLKLGLMAKAVLSVAVLIVAEHQWLVSQVAGTMASPESPRWLIIGFGVAYGALILLACFLLIRDVLGGLLYLVSRPVGSRLLAAHKLPHFMAVSALTLGAWGTSQAVRVPDIRRMELPVAGLAAEFDGYRIVHLTDLHVSRLLDRPWLDAVVDQANALNPDLILISGDLVDGTPSTRANDIPPLGRLAAKDGVYAVAGNHEYYAAYSQWIEVFRRLGITVLENEYTVIREGAGELVIAGVPDQVGSRYGQIGPDVAKALAGRPQGVPVILMDHRPGNARSNRAQGVDLQLSGHTHGGHIRGFDLLVARFNAGFVSGLYDVDGMSLYVSNGAGLWPGFPQRIGRPSEITEITLRRRS